MPNRKFSINICLEKPVRQLISDVVCIYIYIYICAYIMHIHKCMYNDVVSVFVVAVFLS